MTRIDLSLDTMIALRRLVEQATDLPRVLRGMDERLDYFIAKSTEEAAIRACERRFARMWDMAARERIPFSHDDHEAAWDAFREHSYDLEAGWKAFVPKRGLERLAALVVEEERLEKAHQEAFNKRKSHLRFRDRGLPIFAEPGSHTERVPSHNRGRLCRASLGPEGDVLVP